MSRKRKLGNEVLKETQLVEDSKVARVDQPSYIFDIEHEEIRNKRQVDDIALNGAKLIREQLNISDNKEELIEYMYDIYFAPRDIALDHEELVFEGHAIIDA